MDFNLRYSMTIKPTNTIIPSPSNISMRIPSIIPVCFSFHIYVSPYHLGFFVPVTPPPLFTTRVVGKGENDHLLVEMWHPNDIIVVGSIKMTYSDMLLIPRLRLAVPSRFLCAPHAPLLLTITSGWWDTHIV